MAKHPQDPGTREFDGLGVPRTPRSRREAQASTAHVVGYARVSTDDQDLTQQRDALKAAGADVIYEEHASGRDRERPELRNALKALRTGDTLLVWRLDRLGRSLVDLVTLVKELGDRGIGVRSVCEASFDTGSANGALIFGLFALLAEFERRLISERTRASLASARARGRKGGRKPRMTPQQVKQARAMLRDPNVTVSSVAETFGVSRGTIYNSVGKVRPHTTKDDGDAP